MRPIVGIIRRILAFCVQHFLKDPYFASLVRIAHERPFGEYLKITDARNQLNIEFYEQVCVSGFL